MAERLQFSCMREREGIEDLEGKTEWDEVKGFYGRKYSETNRGMEISRPYKHLIK
jgi:hypothetical protein